MCGECSLCRLGCSTPIGGHRRATLEFNCMYTGSNSLLMDSYPWLTILPKINHTALSTSLPYDLDKTMLFVTISGHEIDRYVNRMIFLDATYCPSRKGFMWENWVSGVCNLIPQLQFSSLASGESIGPWGDDWSRIEEDLTILSILHYI